MAELIWGYYPNQIVGSFVPGDITQYIQFNTGFTFDSTVAGYPGLPSPAQTFVVLLRSQTAAGTADGSAFQYLFSATKPANGAIGNLVSVGQKETIVGGKGLLWIKCGANTDNIVAEVNF